MKYLVPILLFIAVSSGARETGWSAIVPADNFFFASAGYCYAIPTGDWMTHTYAPIEQFGRGHGARFTAGLQIEWYRFGGAAYIRFIDNTEWENYARENGSIVDAKTYFYNIGCFFAVNPWNKRRISPEFGLEIGFFIPRGEERVSGLYPHTAKYNFLAPNGYSDYVAPFFGGLLRLNNNFALNPFIGYHSAQTSEKLSGTNSRITWYYFGISLEARVPLSLF